MADAPDLSVVVPSVSGWDDLAASLAALATQDGSVRVEVLVADRLGDGLRARIRERYPSVRVLAAPPDASIPALRALAFREARADIVGVVEDHVLVTPDWAGRMVAAHREGALVVTGTIDNAAADRLVDWAAYLCEYQHCLVAPRRGPVEWAPGNNVTYRRALLERFRAVIEEHCWEDRLHTALREAGVMIEARPEISVGHKKHYTIAEYVSQRYLYSRAYAAMRCRGMGPAHRLAYGVAALALPPALLFRMVFRGRRARYPWWRLIASLPLLTLFATAWAGGESVGALLGGGDALARVR